MFKSFADATNIFDLKVIVNTLLREKLFSYYYIVYCEPPSYFQRLLSEFSYFYMKLETRKEETSFCENWRPIVRQVYQVVVIRYFQLNYPCSTIWIW